MKKNYEAPKAEKMEFDYSEAVVASGCSGGVTKDYINVPVGCDETETKIYNQFGTQN